VKFCGEAFEGARGRRVGRSRLKVSFTPMVEYYSDIPGGRGGALGGDPVQARDYQPRDQPGRLAADEVVLAKFCAKLDLGAVVR
jgi:hypothetical protein